MTIEQIIGKYDEAIMEAHADLMRDTLNTAQNKSLRESLELFTAGRDALREKQERENPQALTWDELRKMDDDPVWVVFKADADGTTLRMWCLVENDPYGSLYLTNNLGGREEFATASDFETEGIDAIYRYPPAEEKQ